MTVNLTALAEDRAKMTQGEWTLDDDIPCIYADTIAAGLVEVAVLGDEAVNYDGDGPGIVATHNAADVLVEVARTAIEADKALLAFEAWRPDPARLVDDDFVPLMTAAREARAAHRAALAKVTL